MAARAERRVCVCTSSLSTVVHVTVTVRAGAHRLVGGVGFQINFYPGGPDPPKG